MRVDGSYLKAQQACSWTFATACACTASSRGTPAGRGRCSKRYLLQQTKQDTSRSTKATATRQGGLRILSRFAPSYYFDQKEEIFVTAESWVTSIADDCTDPSSDLAGRLSTIVQICKAPSGADLRAAKHQVAPPQRLEGQTLSESAGGGYKESLVALEVNLFGRQRLGWWGTSSSMQRLKTSQGSSA